MNAASPTIASLRPARLSSGTASSLTLSLVSCSVIVIGFVLASENCRHWFVLPVLLCGIVIGQDAIDWVRGKVDVFSPEGLLGILGILFFFLAPLLHVYWDEWMRYVNGPPEWRPWLGGMALANFLGLLIYRVSRRSLIARSTTSLKQRVWVLDDRRVIWILPCALGLCAVLQFMVYRRFGGILGYVMTYQAGLARDAFHGMGWLFLISESFPLLFVMTYAAIARRHEWMRSWAAVMTLLVLSFPIQMLFGGLRGSRSNTVTGLFIAVGIIHLCVRPLSRKSLLIMSLPFFLFMYLYGFYKGLGMEALSAFQGRSAIVAMQEETGKSVRSLLLWDFGRSDVQAFLLYRVMRDFADYEYAWGRTYYAAAVLWIPRSLWPGRPVLKVKEGTEAIAGMGSYVPRRRESSRVYGLAGETILNFSPLMIPFAFGVWGIAVGWVSAAKSALHHFDSRLLLVPLAVITCFSILQGDSDNIAVILMRKGVFPFLCVLACSRIGIVAEEFKTFLGQRGEVGDTRQELGGKGVS